MCNGQSHIFSFEVLYEGGTQVLIASGKNCCCLSVKKETHS